MHVLRNRVRMAYWLAGLPLMWQEVGSRPGRVILKTIIKMIQTASQLIGMWALICSPTI